MEAEHAYTLAPVAGPVLTRADIVSRVRRAVIAYPTHFGSTDFGIVAPLASVLEFVCDDAVKLGAVWASLVAHGLTSGWRVNDGEPFFAITALGSFRDATTERMINLTCRPVGEIVVRRRAE